MITWETLGKINHVMRDQPCYEAIVSKNDRSGKWGDSEDNPIWRVQQQTLYRWGRHQQYTFKFQTMLDDWQPRGRVNLWDIHSTVQFDGDIACNTRDGNLEITTVRDKLLYSYPIVPGKWEDWELYIYFVEDHRGKLSLKHNGIEVVNLDGNPTMAWNTESYFKIGAYVWTSADLNLPSWPDGINYRRMYFNI